MHRSLATFSLFAAAALAQQEKPSPDELLVAELASPFLHKAPWLTDWDAALAAAKAKQQLIFGYFTTVNY